MRKHVEIRADDFASHMPFTSFPTSAHAVVRSIAFRNEYSCRNLAGDRGTPTLHRVRSVTTNFVGSRGLNFRRPQQ